MVVKKTIRKRVTRKTHAKKGVLAKLVKDVRHLKVVENTLKTVNYWGNSSGNYDVLPITGLIYALHDLVAAGLSGPLSSLKPTLVYRSLAMKINFEWKTTATGDILPPIGTTINYGSVSVFFFQIRIMIKRYRQ